jgi:hypothetical protein
VVLVFLRRPEAIEPLMLSPVSGIHYDDELIHVSFNKSSSMRLFFCQLHTDSPVSGIHISSTRVLVSSFFFLLFAHGFFWVCEFPKASTFCYLLCLISMKALAVCAKESIALIVRGCLEVVYSQA